MSYPEIQPNREIQTKSEKNKDANQFTNGNGTIAHFTVAGENEAGVHLVLIKPFLLYVTNVFLC